MPLIDGKYHGANVQSALARHRLEESKKGGKSKDSKTRLGEHLDKAQEHLKAARDLHSGMQPQESPEVEQEAHGAEESAISALGMSQNEQS